MNEHLSSASRQRLKLVLGIVTLLFILVIAYFVGRPLVSFVSEPSKFQAWVQDKGIFGILAFMGMNILQVFLAVIPGGPFEVVAGYAFGVVRGTIICDLAITIAGTLVFLISRKFGVRFVELFVDEKKFEHLSILKSSKKSEAIIFLLFLIPGTPKDVFSYLVGLTDMKLSHWIVICSIARLPAIFLSVLSGSALSSQQHEIAAILFAAIIVLYVIGLILYRIYTQKNR